MQFYYNIITFIDPVGIDYIHMDRNGIGPGCNSKTAWFIIQIACLALAMIDGIEP